MANSRARRRSTTSITRGEGIGSMRRERVYKRRGFTSYCSMSCQKREKPVSPCLLCILPTSPRPPVSSPTYSPTTRSCSVADESASIGDGGRRNWFAGRLTHRRRSAGAVQWLGLRSTRAIRRDPAESPQAVVSPNKTPRWLEAS